MKIALIAAPFIPVPPICYGGTELFFGLLAEGLSQLGHDVVVYANGESTVDAEVRWYYRKRMWPPTGDFSERCCVYGPRFSLAAIMLFFWRLGEVCGVRL